MLQRQKKTQNNENHVDDLVLIDRAKNHKDSEAFEELCKRHGALYNATCGKYLMKVYRKTYDETMEDLRYNFWRFVRSYDPNRGAKFITHVGNQTRYLCLNLIKANKNTVLINCDEETFFDRIEKQSEHAYSKHKEDFALKMEDVVPLIDKLSQKHQYILTEAYLREDRKSFQEIARDLNVSYQSVLTWDKKAKKEMRSLLKD